MDSIANLIRRITAGPDFYGISHSHDDVKVLMYAGKELFDISAHFCPICLYPLQWAIWLPRPKFSGVLESPNAGISFQGERIAETGLLLKHQLNTDNGTIGFYELRDSKVMVKNPLSKKLYYVLNRLGRDQKNHSLTNAFQEALAVSYAQAVKVYLTIVQGDQYLNVFPMDLHLHIPETGQYLIGLQHTNIAGEHLKKNKKIVVAKIPYLEKDQIYAMGKNHGATNLFQSDLGFKTIRSPEFGFLVPAFAIGIREILIDTTIDLGSHQVYAGHVSNHQHFSSMPELHHVHRFFYPYYKS